MICPHCKTIHHICPRCGGNGQLEHSRVDREYRVYECLSGHRWHEWNGEVIDLKKRRAA